MSEKNKAQLYKGKHEEKGIEFKRVWSMPSPWTFSMMPCKYILEKYVGSGKGWIDPFAGSSTIAEYRNDHNPQMVEKYGHNHCLEAREYCKMLPGKYEGIIFDPPYSFTQIKQHYDFLGRKVSKEFTDMRFYEKVRSVMADKIETGGYAISFGWNTNGFGKGRGFEIVEIVCIAHGGSKNDTIITVEIKK